jgi:hypothetical protein
MRLCVSAYICKAASVDSCLHARPLERAVVIERFDVLVAWKQTLTVLGLYSSLSFVLNP